MTATGRSAPIILTVYFPNTKEGRLELARRVAEIHANAVQRRIKELNCPGSQKLALLDSVIRDVRERIQTAAGTEYPLRSESLPQIRSDP